MKPGIKKPGRNPVLNLFFHLPDHGFRYTREGETTVVEEVLHGNITRQVAEHERTIICTVFCCGIAQRTHLFGIINETIKSFYTAAGCSAGRDRKSVV